MIRNLSVVTPPTGLAVDINTAMLQCNALTEDESLVTLAVQTATEVCEAYTKRTFLTTTYELRLDAFPNQWISWYALANMERPFGQSFGHIYLPKPPAVTLNSVRYIDIAGNDQLLDPSTYITDLGGVLAGSFTPKWLTFFPFARAQLASVRINYTAGYGAAADIPSSAQSAILLLAAHLYRNREATSETPPKEIDLGVKNLLRPLKWGGYQ